MGLVLVVDARHTHPFGWFVLLFPNGLLMCVGGLLWQVFGLLVPVGWALLLYTSGLSTQCSAGGLNPQGVGNLILKRASRLDAFSGYHFRT